ncbi:MAG: hypothetical protein ACH36H_05195 [Candidatus Nanopelagicales bacterium]
MADADDTAAGQPTNGGPDDDPWRSAWQPALVVLAIAAIQMLLPDIVTIGPRWLIPSIELLGAPGVLVLLRMTGDGDTIRVSVMAYMILLIGASATNAILLLRSMLSDVSESGEQLLFAGFGVLIINVLSFALVYWQIDGGGPQDRARRPSSGVANDFQFPQQASGWHWRPQLPDYLFTAYTNIIAFSPTDTMPLTHRVKFLFTLQSSISLLTVLVTLSRAINLIN